MALANCISSLYLNVAFFGPEANACGRLSNSLSDVRRIILIDDRLI